MNIYKLQPNGYIKSKRTFISLALVIIAIITGISISIMDTRSTEDIPLYVYIILFTGLLLFLIYRMLRQLRQQWQSYRLEISDDSVTVNINVLKQITIAKAEIVAIEELPDRRLRIRTAEKGKVVVIPPYLDGYQEVRALLNDWSLIRYAGQSQTQVWNIVFSLLAIAAMAIVFYSKVKYLVLISGGLSFIMLTWGFIYIQRNKLYNLKIKRLSWYVLLILLVVIFKIVAILQ